jgi:hypothetical protein
VAVSFTGRRFGEATDNGSALGLPGSPSRPRSIQDKVLMPISETA